MLNKPLLSTAYLAPISYYAILLQYKDCKIEYYENFIKQSIRNRCEIYGPNGKLRLTIPKKSHKSSKTIITNIKISYQEKWQKLHWNSIVSAYNSSPFFEYYKDEIEPFFNQKETFLIDFNNKLQEVVLQILQEKVTYTSSTEYHQTGNFTDLRNHQWNTKEQNQYDQVFMEKHNFIPNLSILDLLFNVGPSSPDYLKDLDTNIYLRENKSII